MAETVTLTCVNCGKQFDRLLCEERINIRRGRKSGPFCSKGCRNTKLCTGKLWSDEQKAKLLGRTPWNLGKPWSDEVKEKMSEAASNGSRSLEKNGHWKGGRRVGKEGYVWIRMDGGEKLEHVLVMEQHLGRKLDWGKGEVVHHINEDRSDNRLENLQLMTIGEHLAWHNTGERSWKHKQAVERRRLAAELVGFF